MTQELPAPSLPRRTDRGPQASGILVTRRGWRPQDWLERAALEAMRASGPLRPEPGLPAYAGFPWSALIDSIEDPGRLEAPLLRSALRALALVRPKGAALVTVCQHPHLPDHLDRLAAAGVTDVFWTGALPPPEDAAAGPSRRHPSGVRLHPFPALPAPDSPAVAGEGPGGVFAFCPAEAGGNTPRLWGAVAARLVPVLPLPHPALPGPAAVWQTGAVLHDGSGEGLEERLAAIVAAPGRLAAMRAALAGLALLFAPGRLVADIHLCLLERAAERRPAPSRDPEPVQSLLRPLVRQLGDRRPTRAEAALALRLAASDLLCDRREGPGLAPGPETAATWRLLAQARAALPPAHPDSARLDAVLDGMRDRDRLPLRPGRPLPHRGPAPMRVFLLGPRGQRTPVSYPPMHPHLRGRIAFADRPEAADLIVTGWNRDLEDNRDLLAGLCRNGGGPRLVVLSEEPLWDSLWSGGPGPRDRLLDCGDSQIPYRSLNHVNSDIFAFRHLPWFILSDNGFPARQAMLIAEFAALSPKALLDHWARAPIHAAFVAERRVTADYAAVFPAEGLAGLCPHRSRVAELTPGPAVLRIGQGWPGTGPRRQDLPDWHLDKLARLHGRVRVCGAWENTLHRDYITEKPFDAFAIGAIPAVAADADHRLFELILPEAMLNTVLSPPAVAAARIAAFTADPVLAEAWRESAQGLLARLRDTGALLDERQRIADACLHELERALHEMPPVPAAP